MVMSTVCADSSPPEANPDSRARARESSIPALKVKVPGRAPDPGDPGPGLGLLGFFGLRPRDFGTYLTLRAVAGH